LRRLSILLGKLLEALEAAEAFDWNEFLVMAGSSVAIAWLGIVLAVMMYRTKVIDPGAIASKNQAPVQLLPQ
jgi:NAD(P)H-quinone oxidoreductase subunit 5